MVAPHGVAFFEHDYHENGQVYRETRREDTTGEVRETYFNDEGVKTMEFEYVTDQ